MTVAPVPRISLDGYDGQLMHFSCPSYSRPGLAHVITLDRLGMRATCSCEDATCRKKEWRFLDPKSTLCRHLRTLQLHVLPLMKANGVIE